MSARTLVVPHDERNYGDALGVTSDRLTQRPFVTTRSGGAPIHKLTRASGRPQPASGVRSV